MFRCIARIRSYNLLYSVTSFLIGLDHPREFVAASMWKSVFWQMFYNDALDITNIRQFGLFTTNYYLANAFY